jgi:ribosomal protein S18 acetylase RimI-like enzyme
VREDAWLAERLGRPAFTLEEEDERLDAGPGFYQAKVDCADVERVGALERAGMRVVDVNVTLRRAAAPGPEPAGEVRDGTEADRGAVLDIAERDYTVSRFHMDPEVPDEKARLVKRDWADGFFRGTRGDRLLVAPAEGPVAGFHLILDGERARTVDLIAVRGEARGRGLGTALLGELIAMRPERDVVVGTQAANRGSLRLYGRLGFEVADTRYVLHGHAA